MTEHDHFSFPDGVASHIHEDPDTKEILPCCLNGLAVLGDANDLIVIIEKVTRRAELSAKKDTVYWVAKNLDNIKDMQELEAKIIAAGERFRAASHEYLDAVGDG